MFAKHNAKKIVDPVCGMQVDPATAAASTIYQDTQIFFCAESCKKQFEANPQAYETAPRKGLWQRYLARLNKTTGGKAMRCCQ